MAEDIRNWVFALTAAALLSSICRSVTPSGSVKRVVTLVCGLVTVLALVSPVLELDYGGLAGDLYSLRQYAARSSQELEKTNDNLRRSIIEQECAAYILDKAKALGIENISASVKAKWSEDGYWYPVSAEIQADAPEQLRRRLGVSIEAELGIAEDDQIWSDDNGG